MKTRFTQIVAVHLFLIKDKKLLLTRRCNTGYEDGNFSVPAGHVEQGESCVAAMIRETKEEVGIEVKAVDLQLAHVMHRKSDDGYRIDFFFTCHTWLGKPKINEENKCDKLGWFAMDQLPENSIPYIQQAVSKVRAGDTYSELGF